MSNVSIFETRWIDLVFEGKNKEYGAYQLRQENPKTTIKALFLGLLLITAVASIPLLSGLITKQEPAASIIPDDPSITIVEYIQPPKPPIEEAIATPATKSDKPETEIKKEELNNPTVTTPKEATTDLATNEELENNNPNSPNENGIMGDVNGGREGGTGTDPNTNNITPTEEEPTGPYIETTLDVRPAFPGGMEQFYKYVAKNFKTPEIDNDKAIKVLVSFVIEKDGSMTDIRVPRNPGYGLDKEAIRVLKSLKIKWSPGMVKGKPVRTAYSLPINVVMK